MPISSHLAGLRARIGTDLLLLPGVLAVVRNDSGSILMQLRSDTGTWGFPGGSIDPGESPAQALVREVHEETGLIVRPVALLGVLGPVAGTYPNGDQIEVTVSAFACRVVGGTLGSRDDESLSLRWTPEPAALVGHPHLGLSPELLRAGGSWFLWNEEWLTTETGA